MALPTWLWAIVGGTTYDLTDAGILWQEHGDGFGMPPMHRFTQRGPQQHGETNRDFRLDPRTITLIAGFARPSQSDVYDARRRLLDIFKPSNSPILLRWDLANGARRQIDAYYSGSMTLPMGRAAAGAISSQNQSGQTPLYREGVYQRTGLEFFCPDPTFYDPTVQVATLSNAAAAAGFIVPMPVPFTVGGSVFSSSLVIAYAGDWLSYPVLRLTGPLTDPVVTNTTTGEVLSFVGSTIAPGDSWDIDLSYGAKTITDSSGSSQIAALVAGSDLGTFHLAAASDASGTLANTLTLVATGTSIVSALRATWYNRFIGF